MSKKLIRKGLAISAAVALGLTGISAVTATAAGQSNNTFVSLLPDGGKEYTVLMGDTFALKSNQAGTIAESGRDLKWLVSDPAETVEPEANGLKYFTVYDATEFDVDGDTETVTLYDSSLSDDVSLLDGGLIMFDDDLMGDDTVDFLVAEEDTLYEITVDSSDNSISFVSSEDLSTYSSYETEGDEYFQLVRGPRADDGSYVVNSGNDSNTSDKVLELYVEDWDDLDDATVDVSVTAWIDDNDLGTIDDTEYASVTRAVKFLSTDDLTGVASYDAVVLGDDYIDAYVTTSPALNGQQSSYDDIEVGFTYQGETGTDENDAEFNSTTGKYEASGDSFTVIAGSYSVTPYFDGVAIGPKVTVGSPAKVADEASGLASETTNINVYNNDTNTPDLEIRSKTLTATVIYQVIDEDENPVGTGKAVRVTEESSTLPTGAKLNGTSITAGKVFNFTTDSKGQVVLTVTATAATSGKSVEFDAEAEGDSDTNVDFTLNWDDAYYEIFELNNSGSDYYEQVDNDFARGIAVGGSYAFSIAYLDQWAQGPTGDYRVEVETDYRTVSLKYYTMSNGRVTFSVSDDQVDADDEDHAEVNVEVQKKTGTTWAAAANYSSQYWYLYPYAQSNGAIHDYDNDLTSDLALATMVAGDERASQGNDIGWNSDYDDYAWFAATVTDGTDGAVKSGAKVVLSGPSNILFVDGDRSAYGSITVYADNDGDFEVGAISNTAQTDTLIRATSLGKTVTWKTTFSPADGDSGSAISASAPKSIVGGRTLAVTIYLKDKYGNAVDAGTDGSQMSLEYDGPGFVVTDISAVTSLGTDGAYTARVLLSSGDTGVSSFTLSYSQTDLADDNVITKSVDVWVGPIANAKAGAKKGRVIVEAYRAKGKTVSVYVGSTRVASFVANETNDSMVVRGIKSGDRNVRVVLSGAGDDFRGAVTVR